MQSDFTKLNIHVPKHCTGFKDKNKYILKFAIIIAPYMLLIFINFYCFAFVGFYI